MILLILPFQIVYWMMNSFFSLFILCLLKRWRELLIVHFYIIFMQIQFRCIDYYQIASEKERIIDSQINSHKLPTFTSSYQTKDILSIDYKNEIIHAGKPHDLSFQLDRIL